MPLSGTNLATLIQDLLNMVRVGEATRGALAANDRVQVPLDSAGLSTSEQTNMAIRCLNRAVERVVSQVQMYTATATLSTSDADDDGRFPIETYLTGLLEANILSVAYKYSTYFEPLAMADEFAITSRCVDVANEQAGPPEAWYYDSQDHALGLYPRPSSGSDNLQVLYIPRPAGMFTYEMLGTVAIASGTPTAVTGTGTVFTNLVTGDEFGVRPAAGVLPRKWWRVSATPSVDTALVLTESWDGGTISGREFVACSSCLPARRFTAHGPEAILQTALSIWYDMFNQPDVAAQRRAVADAAIQRIWESIHMNGKRVVHTYQG